MTRLSLLTKLLVGREKKSLVHIYRLHMHIIIPPAEHMFRQKWEGNAFINVIDSVMHNLV